MSVLQAFMQGRQARQQENQMMRQNMMQQYMQQNAQGIMSGDEQSIAGLAEYDLPTAIGLRDSNMANQRAERAEGRAVAAENRATKKFELDMAAIEASTTAEQRAREAAALRQGVQTSIARFEAGDMPQEEVDQLYQQFGRPDLVGLSPMEAAPTFLDLADQLEGMQPSAPLSPEGKLKADLDTGRITPEQFEAAAAKSGLRITTDADGNMTFEQGVGVTGGPELGRSGQNALDNKEINSRDTLARLDRIEENFVNNPELLDAQTMMGNIKRQGLEWKDYLGGDLTDEQAKYLVDVTAMRGDVLENANYTIQAITGAAMGVDEAKRIMATLPGIDDSPVVFKAKLDRAMEATKMAVARYNYWRSQGLGGTPQEVGTLSDMKRIMKERADELIAEQAAAGLGPEEAKANAMQMFAKEFGIE